MKLASSVRAVAVSLAVVGSTMAIAGVSAATATPLPGAATSETFPCEENFHHQGNGMCTWVDTRPVTTNDGPHKPFRTYCPDQYPFPAQASFFSDVPIWVDKSIFPLTLRMKAVSTTPDGKDFLGEDLSYAGTSATDPGYASLIWSDGWSNNYHAAFVCSNVPAV